MFHIQIHMSSPFGFVWMARTVVLPRLAFRRDDYRASCSHRSLRVLKLNDEYGWSKRRRRLRIICEMCAIFLLALWQVTVEPDPPKPILSYGSKTRTPTLSSWHFTDFSDVLCSWIGDCVRTVSTELPITEWMFANKNTANGNIATSKYISCIVWRQCRFIHIQTLCNRRGIK